MSTSKKNSSRRSSPEFLRRVEARRAFLRHREIWAAIREYDRLHATGKHRVRGIRAAARKAGF